MTELINSRNTENQWKNKPAAQAVGPDPSRCDSTNM